MARNQPPEPATALFTKLSPEILRFIFQHFCSHCSGDYRWPFRAVPLAAQDNTTLFNLCLVSRYFRGLAQEILYHSFDLDCFKWPEGHSERRLGPFLTTVALRPDLARSVKAVSMRPRLVEDVDFEEAYQIFDVCARFLGTSPSDIYRKGHASQVSSSVIKRPFFMGESIIKDIRQDDYVNIIVNELLTMVVALLPNLVHLGIERGPTSFYTGRFFWEVDVSPATLDALGITALRLKTLESAYGPKHLLSRTPNLETLVTVILGSFPDMPSVRNLHIRREVSIERQLKRCISACTGPLSTFSYTANDIEIFDVIECLDQDRFHASLESLYLVQRRESNYRIIRPMPNLKLFTKLKTIFISTDHISTPSLEPPQLVDALPSNITSFTLVRRDTLVDFTIEDLQHLTKEKPTPCAPPRVTRASAENETVSLDYLWAASDSR